MLLVLMAEAFRLKDVREVLLDPRDFDEDHKRRLL